MPASGFGYAGYRYDAETGLYHTASRYYDPVAGRFLSPDPIGYDGGHSLYAYTGGDPVNHTDPSGLLQEDLGFGGGAGNGAGGSGDGGGGPPTIYVPRSSYPDTFSSDIGFGGGRFASRGDSADDSSGDPGPIATIVVTKKKPAVMLAQKLPSVGEELNYANKELQQGKAAVKKFREQYEELLDEIETATGDASRNAAFRQAKRDAGVPVSQQPDRVGPNIDNRGNVQPGMQYEFLKPDGSRVTIADDAEGHEYLDDPSQSRGPHFNIRGQR